MKFKTLYARNKNGSVQEWTVEVEGKKFRTIVGQVNGQLITSEWTVCLGKNTGKKNETSPEQQATAEAEAKFEKKLKEGYYENKADIDKPKYFEVMLAKEFSKYKAKLDWKKGVGVQIKYNGGRVVATKEGLFSRKGERYCSIPHIEKALQPFFEKNPDAILDGEGFNYELREELNEIMKLLRKTVHITPEDLEASEQKIRFYIYDGFGFGGAKQTDEYLVRKQAIDIAFRDWYKKGDIVHEVPTHVVYSEKELEELYKTFLKDNQEGAIIRVFGVGYENGRSKLLLKYKPVDDDEFEVISVNEGVGKFANRASTLTCRLLKGKFKDGTNTFEATFKGTAKEAVECWKEKEKYIGLKVTIYFNGYTGFGKPNYPRFDYNNWNKGH